MFNPRIAPLNNLKAYQLLYQMQDLPYTDIPIKCIKEKLFKFEEITEQEYELLHEVWREVIYPEEKDRSIL